ncbi:hypothetical protein Tco_0967408 [Tanacetum coccineum]
MMVVVVGEEMEAEVGVVLAEWWRRGDDVVLCAGWGGDEGGGGDRGGVKVAILLLWLLFKSSVRDPTKWYRELVGRLCKEELHYLKQIYNQTSKMAEQDSPPPTITAMKIPIIKKGEYDIWSMRMRQYICHTDHNLWDIIFDGDLQEEAAPAGEQPGPPAPKTAKQLTAKRNQERVKSILLLAIPDEYLLKFHNVPDAKSLWAAIKSSQIALIMRNKPDIDQTDIDDLYNNLRVYEDEMKRSSSSTSNSQNLAFLSSENTSSTNKVSTANGNLELILLVELVHQMQVADGTLGKGTLLRNANQEGTKGKDLMVIMAEKHNNEPSSQALVAQDGLGGYDWSNDFDEPVNYALMAISSSSSSSSSDNEVQNCSKQCLEYFKTLQKNLDIKEKHSRARLEIKGYELALESLESRILRHEKNELAWDRYHAVPTPITGNFLTPRANISFTGLDEYAIRKKIIESQTTELNTDTSKSKTSESVDGEDDVSEVNTVSPVKANETQTVKTQVDKTGQISQKERIGFKKLKACFVCKSTDHLIKDFDFYAKKSPEPKMKTVVNTGKRVVKPVWDNAKRVNQQKISNNLKYPQARRSFISSGVLTRTSLVNPVRPNRKRAVHIVSTARPISTVRL